MTLNTSRLTIGYLWSDLAQCVPWLARDPMAASPNLWRCCWDGVTACCCQSSAKGLATGKQGTMPSRLLEIVSLCNTPIPSRILMPSPAPSGSLFDPFGQRKPWKSNNQTSSHIQDNYSLSLWARHSTKNCLLANCTGLWLCWTPHSVEHAVLKRAYSVRKIKIQLNVKKDWSYC